MIYHKQMKCSEYLCAVWEVEFFSVLFIIFCRQLCVSVSDLGMKMTQKLPPAKLILLTLLSPLWFHQKIKLNPCQSCGQYL